MIETIILALIVSKIKGYNIKPLFKSWTFYPVIIMELLYWIGQVLIWNGHYKVVSILAFFKTAYLCSYLFLILKYEVYSSAIIGSIFILIGGMFNDIAIKANGGFMPVFPTISTLIGLFSPGEINISNDIHILGNYDTQLKILTDFIDLGYSVLSIGDVFIRVFVFLVVYNSIKKVNLTKEEEIKC